MPTYRLYRLDGTGRIHAAEWIEADDDREARSRACEQCRGSRYELWQSKRLVERVTSRAG